MWGYKRIAGSVLAATCLLSSFSVAANTSLEVEEVWARQSIPGAENGAAYGTFINKTNAAIELIAVKFGDSARAAEIHEHVHRDGQMRMRRIESIIIEPEERVVFAPGGLHFMLFGLSEPLEPGGTIDLTLIFSNQDEQTVQATVRPL